MRKDYNISLIALGAAVLGIDYSWNLFPGLPAFFSLNRFLFFGVLAADILFYSEKYLRAGKIYLAGGIILIGSLPYLLFEGGPLEDIFLGPGLKLLGSLACLLFFYVNCSEGKTAGVISAILMLSSGVIAVYVLGGELGIFGGKIDRWRGAVEFTSASGIFDPNIITLYYLPVFAFAPFFKLTRGGNRGWSLDLWGGIFLCFCLVTFFFLNTRAGSLAVASVLFSALILRFLAAFRGDRKERWNVFLLAVAAAGALIYAQIQYDLLGPIIGIWGQTHLTTDTSFAVRLASYRFLLNDLLSSPALFGSGYQVYWQATGWVGWWPHSALVDFYLQGGVLFLLTYLGLFLAALAAGLRGAVAGRDPVEKGCFAGFFCFLIGFIPLAATLTIGGYKLPWAILGCLLGLSAARPSARREKPGA